MKISAFRAPGELEGNETDILAAILDSLDHLHPIAGKLFGKTMKIWMRGDVGDFYHLHAQIRRHEASPFSGD